MTPQVAGANRRWRFLFRCRGSRRESAVVQLFSLGIMSATLQEYDTVRVVKLLSATRWFDGTKGVSRPPAVGDVAIICDQYDPRDPKATVAVEMVDADGMTVWFADFVPEELEFVWRPTRKT